MVLLEIGFLRGDFACQFVGNVLVQPDLAVRVSIAAAHHCAVILEDVNGPDVGLRGELGEFVAPGIDDSSDLRDAHAREGQIVPRRKTDHAAAPGFTLRQQQIAFAEFARRRVGAKSGEIVVEDKGAGVLRVGVATRARISGAKVTLRIVCRRNRCGRGFNLALPRAFGTMRRYEHPFACQRIEAAMRMSAQLKLWHCGGCPWALGFDEIANCVSAHQK